MDGFSSYSLHLFRVAEGLIKLGRYTTIQPITAEFGKGPIPKAIQSSLVNQSQMSDWEMIIHCPTYQPTGKKKVAYNTMWETSRLNKQCVINLNMAELVIVPSAFNQVCFNAQGVKKKMVKVPYEPLLADLRAFWPSPPGRWKAPFRRATCGPSPRRWPWLAAGAA